MDMLKRPPAVHNCSRFFQPEYDIVNAQTGDPIYTIYAAPQRYDAQLQMQRHGLQRFCIVWGSSPQYDIFEIIERALVADLLSPISVLHLTSKKLTIVATLPDEKNADVVSFFYDRRWNEDVLQTQWQNWELLRLRPDQLGNLRLDDPLRLYGSHILSIENFGVYEYEEQIFAFKDVPDGYL